MFTSTIAALFALLVLVWSAPTQLQHAITDPLLHQAPLRPLDREALPSWHASALLDPAPNTIGVHITRSAAHQSPEEAGSVSVWLPYGERVYTRMFFDSLFMAGS